MGPPNEMWLLSFIGGARAHLRDQTYAWGDGSHLGTCLGVWLKLLNAPWEHTEKHELSRPGWRALLAR